MIKEKVKLSLDPGMVVETSNIHSVSLQLHLVFPIFFVMMIHLTPWEVIFGGLVT
jgi:hypothetical protein